MAANPRITRLENRDEICTIQFLLYNGSDTGTRIVIAPGRYADLDSPITFGAQVPVVIELEVFVGNRIDPRRVTLWYQEIDAKYQFIYTVSPEDESTDPPEPVKAKSPTTPGKDVVLGIDYFGDGVVIVGTGDL